MNALALAGVVTLEPGAIPGSFRVGQASPQSGGFDSHTQASTPAAPTATMTTTAPTHSAISNQNLMPPV